MHPRSLFSLSKPQERQSKDGDPVDVLAGAVEFEHFRPPVIKVFSYSNGAKDRRPPFDPLAMFKVLVIQAHQSL